MKVFKPFWSYDIEKTESWLSFMAEQGYQLTQMNTKKQQFFFEKDAPRIANYWIVYDKSQEHVLPEALQTDGWFSVFNDQKWQVMANNKQTAEIKTSPVRDGIINRNRKLVYVFATLMILLLFSLLPSFMVLGISLLFTDMPITFVASPFWMVTIFLGLLLIAIYVLVIYTTIKLYKANRRLETGVTRQQMDSNGQKELKLLKKSGIVMAKKKFAWNYSPDKLENWLEGMEAKGFHLYQISKLGVTFYFKKGSPRKVSYCADYQNNVDQSYFEMHQDAGWKLMFTSKSMLAKWSIWSGVYKEGESAPQLYSDRIDLKKHAKRVAVTYMSLFIPIIVMYIALLISQLVFELNGQGISGIFLFNIIVSGILIIEFGIFAMKSWLYYKRIKRGLSPATLIR